MLAAASQGADVDSDMVRSIVDCHHHKLAPGELCDTACEGRVFKTHSKHVQGSLAEIRGLRGMLDSWSGLGQWFGRNSSEGGGGDWEGRAARRWREWVAGCLPAVQGGFGSGSKGCSQGYGLLK